MSNRRVVQLVRQRVSKDTCDRLEELLDQCKKGEVIGLAYISILPQAYYVDAVGEANRRATLTRGALRALDDLMRERSRYK